MGDGFVPFAKPYCILMNKPLSYLKKEENWFLIFFFTYFFYYLNTWAALERRWGGAQQMS